MAHLHECAVANGFVHGREHVGGEGIVPKLVQSREAGHEDEFRDRPCNVNRSTHQSNMTYALNRCTRSTARE
jgi:hypothetical protein